MNRILAYNLPDRETVERMMEVKLLPKMKVLRLLRKVDDLARVNQLEMGRVLQRYGVRFEDMTGREFIEASAF